MSWLSSTEFWTAFGSVGAFVVIAVSALLALVQLRHMRAGNELEALLSVQRTFQDPPLQEALRYTQFELPERMRDPAYRATLEQIGFVDQHMHPEMVACNWFNNVGTLVKNGLLSERLFLDLFARLVNHYWRVLEPTVAVLRRRRGSDQYESFEYLAMRSRRWRKQHAGGTYPRGAERLPVPDPWAESDSPPT